MSDLFRARTAAPRTPTARRLRELSAPAAVALLIVSLGAAAYGAADEEPDRKLLASESLAPRNAAPDGPRFERLRAERTGLDFVHRWTPAREAGGGVALGDFDGDGRPDVFLTRPDGGNRLYRNLGEMRFEDATDAAGLGDDVAWGTGASFVDVDGDGHLDLYVCGHDTPNRMYVNQGDGTYLDRAADLGLDFVGASVMAAFADYDVDGDVDLFLLTNRSAPPPGAGEPAVDAQGMIRVPDGLLEYYDVMLRPDGVRMAVNAGQFDRLFRNDGETFTDVTATAGLRGNYHGLGATWWDYDDDGDPDLHVANDYFGPDQLFQNQGDGTFVDVARRAFPHTPWFSMGADVADVDNDGRLDLLATDMAATTHEKRLLNRGDLASAMWFLTAAEPRQYLRNALYRNTGTGRFMEVAYLAGLASTDWTWSPKFGDLDDDGRVDLFVTTGMTRDYFNSDLHHASVAHGRETRQSGRMSGFWVDKPQLREANLAFRNLGELAFENVSAEWGLDDVGVSFGAALGDLDGDGDLDIVVNDFEAEAGLWHNRSSEGHRVVVRLVGRVSHRDGLGALVRVRTASGRQVRYHTLARGYQSANEPIVHFGLGDDARIERLTVEWPSGHVQRFDGLDADARYTVTEPDGEPPRRPRRPPTRPMFQLVSGVRPVERPHDDFERQPLLPYRLSQLGPGLAVADVDGDGDEDFFLGGPARQQGGLFLASGPARWDFAEQGAVRDDRIREDMGAVFFDVDGDDDLDLYVGSGGVESDVGSGYLRDRLYLNDGDGRFSRASEHAVPDLRHSTSAVCAADFDRDGDVDLFVGSRSIPGEYPRTPESHLLRNDGGRLVDATDEVAPGLRTAGLVTGAVWSDADDDGWIDLVVTHDWGPVSLWRNTDGTLVDHTEAAGLAERTGWWTGVASRDVDGDGDIDYLVTNLGLNTRYRASADAPALLFYGDWDGSGIPRLVEAETEDGILYPLRGRVATTEAIPFLGAVFPSFADFARATLADVYTQQALDESLRLHATTFETGLLVNDGSARFEFAPLPRLAQAAPSFGAVLTDLDGDGLTDAFLAQNFFAPHAETGRMDGGVSLALTGRGDGTFAPVAPDASGLVITGDGMGAVATDVNGDAWVDLVVSVNDAEVVAAVRRPVAGVRMVSVALRGARGNPTAVGARVTLVRSDGVRQTAEVTAGSGYLSQSSPRLAFGLGTATVERIEVRWPDGRTTTHRSKARSGTIEITRP